VQKGGVFGAPWLLPPGRKKGERKAGRHWQSQGCYLERKRERKPQKKREKGKINMGFALMIKSNRGGKKIKNAFPPPSATSSMEKLEGERKRDRPPLLSVRTYLV